MVSHVEGLYSDGEHHRRHNVLCTVVAGGTRVVDYKTSDAREVGVAIDPPVSPRPSHPDMKYFPSPADFFSTHIRFPSRVKYAHRTR